LGRSTTIALARNADTHSTHRIQYWNRPRNSTFDFDQFQTANGLTLPESYLQFIREQDGETSRQHGGREWRLKSASQLNETVKVGGAGNKPFHSCVQLFIKLHLEFTGADSVQSTAGPLKSDRVFGGFAFADDNADYLYLDPFDDFSVWLFHHDGADVELVARTFTDFCLQDYRPDSVIADVITLPKQLHIPMAHPQILFTAVGSEPSILDLTDGRLSGTILQGVAIGDPIPDSNGSNCIAEINSVMVRLPSEPECPATRAEAWLAKHVQHLELCDATMTIEFLTPLGLGGGSFTLTLPFAVVKLCADSGICVKHHAIQCGQHGDLA